MTFVQGTECNVGDMDLCDPGQDESLREYGFLLPTKAHQTTIPGPPATHHRHSQLQAQRTPADDQGQDTQQADPWGKEGLSDWV